MMACPEPVMDQEARFLEMLAQAKKFARNGTDLAMLDDAGNRLGRLVQTDAD